VSACSNPVRKRKRLSWQVWGADVERFIAVLDEAVAPDLVIIGGGVSKDAHRFLPALRTRPIVLPARLRNDAGIVGAALYARDQVRSRAARPAIRTSAPERLRTSPPSQRRSRIKLLRVQPSPNPTSPRHLYG
jgi:hypothetical protein